MWADRIPDLGIEIFNIRRESRTLNIRLWWRNSSRALCNMQVFACYPYLFFLYFSSTHNEQQLRVIRVNSLRFRKSRKLFFTVRRPPGLDDFFTTRQPRKYVWIHQRVYSASVGAHFRYYRPVLTRMNLRNSGIDLSIFNGEIVVRFMLIRNGKRVYNRVHFYVFRNEPQSEWPRHVCLLDENRVDIAGS